MIARRQQVTDAMPATDFFVTTARNLETLLAEELRGLG
jgi:hypothetical protein